MSPEDFKIFERKQALKSLKEDFKAEIEYIDEIEFRLMSQYDESEEIEMNLDYLIRDNSDLNHNSSMETRLRQCQILKEWHQEVEKQIEDLTQ